MTTKIRWPRRLAPELLASLGLALAFLWPLLGTGYLSDDLAHSLSPGVAQLNGLSPLGWTLRSTAEMIQQGRFYPAFWFHCHAVFHLFRDLVAYKALVLGLVLLDLGLLYALVRRLGGDRSLAALAMVSTLGLFQFRTYYDPILAFHGHLQVVAALTLGSLLTLQVYLDGGRRRWLGLSAGLLALDLLVYEVAYPFFLMHLTLILAGRPTWLGRLRAALPTLAVVGACTLATLIVRRVYGSSDHYVLKMNPEPGITLLTLGRQLSGALPLSYFALDPDGLFGGFKEDGPALMRWIGRPDALALSGVAMAVALLVLRHRLAPAGDGSADPRPRWGRLAAIGLLLAVLPAALIAVSVRYQGEVDYGRAYVPVFIQYFGVGLLLALGLRAIAAGLGRYRLVGPPVRLALAASLALATGLAYRANCWVADAVTAPPGTPAYHSQAAGLCGQWHPQRVNLQAALAAGLMNAVPPHTLVKVAHEYPFWHDFPLGIVFYATYAEKLLLIAPPSTDDPESPQGRELRAMQARSNPPSPSPPLRLRDEAVSLQSGYVVLAKLEPDGPPRSREFRLFVRDPRIDPGSAGAGFAVVAGGSEGTVVLHARDLKLLRSGPGWALVAYRSETPIELDPDSIRPVLGPAAVALGGGQPAPRR